MAQLLNHRDGRKFVRQMLSQRMTLFSNPMTICHLSCLVVRQSRVSREHGACSLQAFLQPDNLHTSAAAFDCLMPLRLTKETVFRLLLGHESCMVYSCTCSHWHIISHCLLCCLDWTTTKILSAIATYNCRLGTWQDQPQEPAPNLSESSCPLLVTDYTACAFRLPSPLVGACAHEWPAISA